MQSERAHDVSLHRALGRLVFKRITAAIKEFHRSQWEPLTGAELRERRRLLVKTLWGDASSRDRHPLEVLPPV
jgi:hypothetical protein